MVSPWSPMRPEILLTRHLRQLLGAGLAATTFAACGERIDTTACLIVADEEECPSVEEAAQELEGSKPCTDPLTKVKEVVAFAERTDFQSQTDTGGESPLDHCCYEVVSKVILGGACMEGRPMMHQEGPVVAPLWPGAAWGGADLPGLVGLSGEARAALAHWQARQAQAEHASVAAFSRLALELIAHGAPPELLLGVHGAAADEVRHARRAFALAGAYAGEAVGPGPFSVPARAVPSLAALAAATAIEGAVGETLATLMAAERLLVATDPAARAALAEIVRDEAGHAALGWRILRWARAAGGAEVDAAVAGAFARLPLELDGLLAGLPEAVPAGVEAHGMLPRGRMAAALAVGVSRVLEPAIAGWAEDGEA